jgi:hypothetical protein
VGERHGFGVHDDFRSPLKDRRVSKNAPLKHPAFALFLGSGQILGRLRRPRLGDPRKCNFDDPLQTVQGRGQGILLLHIEVPGIKGFDLPPDSGCHVEGALDLCHTAYFGFFFGVDGGLVRLVGLDHAPFLLLGGDLDQDPLGDDGVLAALVKDRLGEPVQREGLRDRCDGLADDPGQLLLLVAAALPEAFEGLGLLDGGEVRADRVFDQRDLLVIRAVQVDGGDGGQARPFGRDAAPLAGDHIGDAAFHPEEDRGDHALLLDRFDEFVEGRRIDVFPGLVGVGLEIGQGHLVQPAVHESFRCCHNVLLSADRKDQRPMEPTKLRAAGALIVLTVPEILRMSIKSNAIFTLLLSGLRARRKTI